MAQLKNEALPVLDSTDNNLQENSTQPETRPGTARLPLKEVASGKEIAGLTPRAVVRRVAK